MRNIWNFLVPSAWKRADRQVPKRLRSTYQLFRGQFKPSSGGTTLLFFTVHKAASSFCGQLLRLIAAHHGRTVLDPEGYCRSVAASRSDALRRRPVEHLFGSRTACAEGSESTATAAAVSSLLFKRGCFYGPLRNSRLIEYVEHLEDFRVIVMVRDPRDCLTSLFYSLAYSHRAPGDPNLVPGFEARRQLTLAAGVDEFVLSAAPAWLENYRLYCQALGAHPHIRLLKYEQLVTDFEGWRAGVEEAWGLPIEGGLRRQLWKRADFTVSQEDVYSHKRQVQPGDHRRKLEQETIQALNDLLRPVLVPLGYATPPAESEAA